MQFACRLRSLTAMPLFPSRMRRRHRRPIPALFICSGRSPFLTHSTLMAPFTPASAASPGSTMNTKSVALFHTQDLYLLQSSRLVEGPFVSNLRGGWMPPSFDSYLFFPLHPAALLSTDISLSLPHTLFRCDKSNLLCSLGECLTHSLHIQSTAAGVLACQQRHQKLTRTDRCVEQMDFPFFNPDWGTRRECWKLKFKSLPTHAWVFLKTWLYQCHSFKKKTTRREKVFRKLCFYGVLGLIFCVQHFSVQLNVLKQQKKTRTDSISFQL